jgi:hypothetical protein
MQRLRAGGRRLLAPSKIQGTVFSAAMVFARLAGSSRSSGSGRPWPTSQNGQRRVHLSPMIMNVAVPLPKHSPMFGQVASSHTVWRLCSRRIDLIS